MFIVIEGVDGAGKTTLASRIARVVGDDVKLIHRGPIKKHPLYEYAFGIASIMPYSQNVIADRWHVGEMIYGPLYRGKSQMTNQMAQWIELFLDSRGAVKVWMHAPLEIIQQRLVEKGEDFLQEEHTKTVLNFYKEYCTIAPNWTLVPYNYDEHTIHDLITMAHGRAAEAEQRIRKHPTFVGASICETLFIMPKSDGYLAGAPYAGSPGDIIIRLLRGLRYPHIRQIGFVSAYDEDIANLINDVEAKHVIVYDQQKSLKQLMHSLGEL